MDVSRIEDAYGSNKIDNPRLKSSVRCCIFYKDEVCTAPKIRFEACRACYRINPHLAARGLLEKIKDLATRLFNLPATEPGQPPRE